MSVRLINEGIAVCVFAPSTDRPELGTVLGARETRCTDESLFDGNF